MSKADLCSVLEYLGRSLVGGRQGRSVELKDGIVCVGVKGSGNVEKLSFSGERIHFHSSYGKERSLKDGYSHKKVSGSVLEGENVQDRPAV